MCTILYLDELKYVFKIVLSVQQSQGFAGSGQPQSVNVAPSGYSPYGTQPQGSLPPATFVFTFCDFSYFVVFHFFHAF